MDNFAIGDIVKIMPFYLANYQEWGLKVKDKPAKVVAVKHRQAKIADIPKEDRPMYRARYGLLQEYDLIELMIDIEGTIYEVSQFGFDK